MNIINYNTIINDICGEKYFLYVREFPKLFTALEDVNLEPTKVKSLLTLEKLKKYPNVTTRLKKIYGRDIIIKLDTPKAEKIKKVAEVIHIDEHEYENWFKEFMNPSSHKIVTLYSYCFNEIKKQYIVSVVYTQRA